MKNFVLICSALLLSACGATGNRFSSIAPPSDGKARVYIYRPSAFIGGGVNFAVGVNHENIGRLRNGGYLTKELPPGEYDIWAKTEAKRGILLKLDAGDVKCIRGGIDAGLFIGRPSFDLVSLNECRREIIHTKQSF